MGDQIAAVLAVQIAVVSEVQIVEVLVGLTAEVLVTAVVVTADVMIAVVMTVIARIGIGLENVKILVKNLKNRGQNEKNEKGRVDGVIGRMKPQIQIKRNRPLKSK